jgi:hypothetical protein
MNFLSFLQFLVALGFFCTISFVHSSDTNSLFSEYDKILGRETKNIEKPSTDEQQEEYEAPANISTKTGKADLRLILLFHPQMKDFIYQVGSFLKPIPESVSVDYRFYLKERQQDVDSKSREIPLKRKKLDEKIKKLKRQQQKLQTLEQKSVRKSANLKSNI